MKAFNRVENLIGKENLEILSSSSVALFGVGGVGGFVAEALVRSGIGKIAVFDSDTVDETNINRQVIATISTIGKDKVEVIKERLLSINPNLKIETYKVFYLPEKASQFDLSKYDYIIDAVDTVSAKLEIISRAKTLGKKVISCMGTGGKLQMESLRVCDITKTSGCPLARVMRRELKRLNIEDVKVVYSPEDAQKNCISSGESDRVPPSMIFVPATAGLYIAREVVLDLINTKRENSIWKL